MNFQRLIVAAACLCATASYAAPLNLVQDPAGSGLYTVLVQDTFDGIGAAVADEWSFEAEVADRINVRIEAAVGNARPRVRLMNTAGTVLQSVDGGTDGVGAFYVYTVPTPGTYRIRAYTDHQVSAYALRVDVARGLDLEAETNDTPANANVLTPAVGAGAFNFAVGGLITANDVADTFSLGTVTTASDLNLEIALPGSTLTAGDLRLQLSERRSSDRSLDFNGSTYAAIPHNAVFDAIENANALTIEAWVYIRSWPQSYFAILDKYRATGDWGWVFTIENGNGGISFWSGNNLRASSNVTPSVNAWHHVAVAYDHGANTVRFYLDGDLVATTTSPGPLTNTDTDSAYIGYGPSGSTNEFNNGLISEVRLWNQALTDLQIKMVYATRDLSPAMTQLVGLWRFDEGSGLTALDSSASAQHAILGNGDATRVPAWAAGAIRPAAQGSTSLAYTFTGDAQAWVQLSASANRGISGRYLLSGTMTDGGGLQLVSSSLPAAGGTTTTYTQWINLAFDDELNAASANNTSNYGLRGAGPDGAFDTGDDVAYSFLNPSYVNGTTLTLALANGPLQPGLHRFTIGLGLRDRAGNSLSTTYVHDFTSEQLGLFKVENQNNNSFATATQLDPMMADGSGFIMGARGNISETTDADYYSFTANANDQIMVATENVGFGTNTGQIFRIVGPNHSDIVHTAGSNGVGQMTAVATTAGTYYVRVNHHNTYSGEYRFVVTVRPGPFSFENEGNNSIGAANAFVWVNQGLVRTAAVGGLVANGDTADWFGLGYLDGGTGINLSLTHSVASALVPLLEITNSSGVAVLSGAAGENELTYAVPADKAGNYFVRLRASSGADLFARYQLTATLGDTSAPVITSSTLPAEGATVSNFFDVFQLGFSENMLASSVNQGSNYTLRNAGADDQFGTVDDQTYSIVTSSTYSSGLSASFRLTDGPAQPGRYRFEATAELKDLYGNALNPFVRTFTIEAVEGWVYEARQNESFDTATSLEPLAIDGSRRVGKARGAISHSGDGDYYSFSADAQDRVLITVENVGHLTNTGLYYRVYGPSRSQITAEGTNNGTGQLSFVAPTSGTYYVYAQHHNTWNGEYRIAVSVTTGSFEFESEGNNTIGAADSLTLASAPSGARAASISGVLNFGDTADWYALGFLDAGTSIAADVTTTPGSGLVWMLDVLTTGSTVVVAAETGAASLDYTIPSGGGAFYYVRLRASSGAGMFGQYVLSLSLGDSETPSILSDTLPAEGSAVSNFFGDFQLNFSEPLIAASVNQLGNYDLRGAGSDGLFGTADDDVYTMAMNPAYSAGANARYRVVDGPLQPGNYRFRTEGLQDLYGNTQAAPYTRTFTITAVDGYVYETRSNDTYPTATSLGSFIPDGDGAFIRGRGQISSSSDLDLYSFHANAGDRILVTTENVNSPVNSGLMFRIVGPNQANLASFSSNNGSDQGGVVAATTGTHFVRVEYHNAYYGEYRFVVSVFGGDYTLETEANNTAGAANTLPWNAVPGMQLAKVAGAIYRGDTGDWFRLGSIAEGTTVTLSASKPPSSTLPWILDILNAGSTAVATGAVGASPFNYTIPAGGSGTYFARIRSNDAGGLQAHYRLTLSVSDGDAPRITTDTLPAEGSTHLSLIDRFTLTFSEDMLASTVNDLANYDLRHAGADALFDTADDVIVSLVLNSAYSTGVSTTLRTANTGTFPAGDYRFQTLPGLQDKVGNPLTPAYTRHFTIGQLPGYAYEAEPNNSRETATSLDLLSTQDGFASAGGRGNIFNGSDNDYWRFELQAGDRLLVLGETVGSPVNSNLNYQLLNPAGVSVAAVIAENTGSFSLPVITAATAGTYTLRVHPHNTPFTEYRFRTYVHRGELQIEAEPNNTSSAATAITLAASGTNRIGSIAGVSRVAGDLDYINLGSLSAGTTVFLSTRQPAHSTFVPVVALYNAAGQLVPETNGGRTGDGVAQVPLTVSGTYYAVVRTSGTTHSLAAEYLLDVLVAPTADVSFPNLQVTQLTPPPAAGLESGATSTLTFRVDNLGNLATAAVTWVDRVVLSVDQIYGNADDIEVAVFNRSGPLVSTDHYLVSNAPIKIPDGVSGQFYLIVRTDHSNTVAEFMLEGDNETVTENPISITRADYPDLVIEDLTLSEPDSAGLRTVNWVLANRGSGLAASGYTERIVVRHLTSAKIVAQEATVIGTPLGAEGTLPRSFSFTTLAPGEYFVEVTADALTERYEYNAEGHEAAEINNTATKDFSITQLYTLTVQADPVAGGTVTGQGSFPAGSNRTVTATPNEPYLFVGWFEGALLRSVESVYVTNLSSDRTLTARFAYPTITVTTQIQPANTGVVTGGGTHSVGADVLLQANPLPGYSFSHWSEGAANLGTSNPLTFGAASDRTIRANFAETNPAHVVTTGTLPADLAVVTGAGTYTNGQSASINAPATITVGETEYVFVRLLLNGTPVSTSASLNKTFTTQDAPALHYVAEYSAQALKPTVQQVTSNLPNRIGATSNFQLTVRFDRAMSPAVKPLVEVISANADARPSVSTNGAWTSANTYVVPAITVTSAHGGDYLVKVSGAHDTQNREMNPVELYPFVIDVTAPALPTLAKGASTATSAAVTWNGYEAPADLASFRVYRSAAAFTRLDGLSPIGSLSAAARTYTFNGLTIDTDYHVAIVPVDQVGNVATAVTSFLVRVESELPPAVEFDVEAVSTEAARITWTYDSSGVIGFKGFKVYRSNTAFTSIEGLTALTTLGAAARSFEEIGLDRTQSYHYAVVAINQQDQSVTAVASKPWKDPLSGTLSTDFTVTEPLLVITQTLTIVEGATLTVPAGTTIAFAPGAGVTVESGRIVAEGTALAPVIFTSLADVEQAGPSRGSWTGLTLADATRSSVLRHVWVNYGMGVAITAGNHTLDTFAAAWNELAGLQLTGAVTLELQNAYLVNNTTGLSVEAGASLTVAQSILKNNDRNAAVAASGTLSAQRNWWGTANAAAIAGTLSGAVDAANPLTEEPILSRGLRSADGTISTGSASPLMSFASLNAVSYRVSEDVSFADVLFVDVPRNPLSTDLYNRAAWQAPVALSGGAGTKTLYAQFRSPTGTVSAPVSFTLDYVTSGPLIGTFSLSEGQAVHRPLIVTATASSALPLTSLTLTVDETVIATSDTASVSTFWDIRSLTPGVHRVRVAALDQAGNLAARTANVVVSPNPPAAPAITSPVDGSDFTANYVTVTGATERFGQIRIHRNGTVVATTTADADGLFTAVDVPLVEGVNQLAAIAFDAIGATSSSVITIDVDSGAPNAVNLLPIEYNVGEGVFLDWELPTSGEIPVSYRVFWHAAPFTSAAEAAGQSTPLSTSHTLLKTLPAGQLYFAVVGYDHAGNASALSNVRSFKVDMTPPSFAIVYHQDMPVGPGNLGITVTASEALRAAPVLLVRPADGSLVSVKLAPAGGDIYTAEFPVTLLSAKSGRATVGINGVDLAGNSFVGAPSGIDLVFDVTKPTAVITTSVPSPIQTANPVALSVNVTLSELPKSGTTPSLSFAPPEGAQVPVALTGNGLNWVGSLTVAAGMGSGNGTFLLNVEDQVGNAGTVITSGDKLELYTGDAPSAPDAPATFTVLPLKGGYIRLTWSAADKALSYRIYREAGAGAAVPVMLVHEDVTALTIDDLPPADGAYRYVVRAYRLGAESAPSGVRATTSDRTAPPAPTTTTASLGASGVNLAWTVGDGETPAKWVIYRNDVAVATVNNAGTTTAYDAPPRGVMTYAIAAADTLGNEAKGPSATMELQVGAVSSLVATVDPGTGTTLTWSSSDTTATGFNVYRNGAKQNDAPVEWSSFTDTFNANGQAVSYLVTAVNAAGQESAARGVLVQPLTATIRLNPSEDGDLVSVARYFDTYRVTYTIGAAANAPVSFAEGEIVRAVAGEPPVQAEFPLPSSTPAGETNTVDVVVPAPSVTNAVQGTSITLRGASDAGGSVVQYRFIQDFESAQAPSLMMTLTADSAPLAGGLTDFKVRVYNRGHAPIDLLLSRAGNTEAGELEMLVLNADGVLVATMPFLGTAPGVIINGRGDAFLRVESGDYADISFPGVLVPEALGGQTLTFRARFKTIYHAVGSELERSNGPLEGSMASSATAAPYYGTAQTTQPSYSDNQPVNIFGQALSRETGLPVPNVKLRIGLRVRGAVLRYEVVTNESGAYEFAYTPSAGLAGEMTIWAAHPEVIDQLDQVRVNFFRLFTKPGRIEAIMSKNDKLDFDVSLLNPGDLTLSGLAVSFRAFRLEGDVEVPVGGLTGTARSLPASVNPRSEPRIGLRLQATLDVPDDAQFEFSLTTAQGATTKLAGTVSFRPALAVLSTVSPANGYAEVGVGRGQLKSVEVTVQNRGLRDLTGVKLTAPANVPWMHVNLAPDANGEYPLNDIPVGAGRTFTVVFAPPSDAPVGYYDDFLVIKGENSSGDYRLNLFATVTSEEKGAVQYKVTNIFGQPVPNASVWMRNSTFGVEVGPVLTDAHGEALVPNLMEGDWQWKTQASGHGGRQGSVSVIPDQTVSVETELTVNMVSVKFSVVPVPFTDYYEIKIEQTFQTRTPVPNLVMSPPHQTLTVEAGWSGTLMYTLRNEGLRSMFDVVVNGANLPTMRATPMISFIPELKAQQTIEIPVFFEYFGPPETAAGSSPIDGLSALGIEGGSSLSGKQSLAAAKAAMSVSDDGVSALSGPVEDFLECYEEFSYGTISFKAEGGISSVSGQPYTVGANATIDVDELLALFCDGECPESVTGGGVVGAICNKLASKAVEAIGKKTKVIDLVCKAANIIKAVACAAAQLPTGQVQAPPPPPPNNSPGSGGRLSSPGSFPQWEVIGGGCFVAGTPISLADGSVRTIEQITQGSRLLASPTGGIDTVAQVMFLSSDHVRELSFRLRDDTSAPTTALRLTHDHRVWVDGRGWTFASEVPVGAWLHGADGRLYQVTHNERLPGRHDVYGLHMDSDNVIYAAGVLTEDQCFKDTPNFSVNPQMGGAK